MVIFIVFVNWIVGMGKTRGGYLSSDPLLFSLHLMCHQATKTNEQNFEDWLFVDRSLFYIDWGDSPVYQQLSFHKKSFYTRSVNVNDRIDK